MQAHRRCGAALLAFMVAATTVSAETLYRWVDEHGHVTYQDRPPPASAVESEIRTLDPDRNVVPSSPATPPAAAANDGAEPQAPTVDTQPPVADQLSPIERAILAEEWRRRLEEEEPQDGAPLAPTTPPAAGAEPGTPATGASPLPTLPGGALAPGAPLIPPGASGQ